MFCGFRAGQKPIVARGEGRWKTSGPFLLVSPGFRREDAQLALPVPGCATHAGLSSACAGWHSTAGLSEPGSLRRRWLCTSMQQSTGITCHFCTRSTRTPRTCWFGLGDVTLGRTFLLRFVAGGGFLDEYESYYCHNGKQMLHEFVRLGRNYLHCEIICSTCSFSFDWCGFLDLQHSYV